MRTVTYKSLLDGTLKMAGELTSSAQDDDKLKLSEFLSQGLSACHEYWRWPELVTIESRVFRVAYDNTATLAAGTEVYFPATQSYYRALRSTLGHPPAELVSGSYITNTSYWWEMEATVAGEDWEPATAYTVGTLVRNPGDGLYYACWQSHTSASSFSASDGFGQVLPFRPYVAYEQAGQTAIEAVIECYDRDPRSDPAALKVAFALDGEGVRFDPAETGPVWIEFRRRCPDYAWSAEWSATTFTANSVVYYPPTGEVYKAGAAAAAGDVPGTAAVWVLQAVPYIFRHAAKHKALAAWLQAEGQTDKALVFDNDDPVRRGKFQTELEEQVWQYTKLQGQTGRVQRK